MRKMIEISLKCVYTLSLLQLLLPSSYLSAVMRQFNHPHIIKLFGVLTHGVSTYIVMELAPLGQVSLPPS